MACKAGLNRGRWWLAAGLLLGAGALRAQVTVTVLGSNVGNSIAYGAGGGQQVGIDTSNAALWTGSAGGLVSLNPSVATSSFAYVTNGSQQGGRANFTNTNGTDVAALWSGTAGSFVNLNPTGAGSSGVLALSATQQGGYAFYSGVSHATLWSGTAGSATDLNPSGAGASELSAMTATQQGGYATFSGDAHAALWSGTAGSFVDLHPTGAVISYVYAMSATNQAGAAYFSGSPTAVPHAAMWSGTAGSFIDLDPGNTSGSVIYAMAGGYQVGVTLSATDGSSHAALWQGSAATYYDFQAAITAALGSSFTSSTLRGADLVGGTLYLVGEGIDPIANTSSAVLIVMAIPEPGVVGAVSGLAALGVAAVVRRRRVPIN